MEFVVTLAIACGIVYLFARRNRERNENVPLRNEIEARVTLRTSLHRASVLGTGGFGGTRGMWIPLRGRRSRLYGRQRAPDLRPGGLDHYAAWLGQGCDRVLQGDHRSPPPRRARRPTVPGRGHAHVPHPGAGRDRRLVLRAPRRPTDQVRDRAATGIPFSRSALRWAPGDRAQWRPSARWHVRVSESTGFTQPPTSYATTRPTTRCWPATARTTSPSTERFMRRSWPSAS